MSIHLKRIVFFFCILCLGLGCCLGNQANAQDPGIIYELFLSGVFYQHDPMKIRGRVFLLTDNKIGLPDVVIYSAEPWDGGPDTKYVPVAVTDGNGYYVFTPEDRVYTLIPRKNGYQFTPEGSSGSGYNFFWPNFAAYWPREISGRVTHSDGSGFANVGIYHNTLQVAVTDDQGYYKVSLPPSEYTLIPQKNGYLFTPPSRSIPADQSNHGNEDFTEQKLTPTVTISGNVKWVNTMQYSTIASNPIPGVAVEAYAEDGSLTYRFATDVDGNYSIPVPVGWTGWVKPSNLDFDFNPFLKVNYYNLQENRTQNYSAPYMEPSYKITVSVKKPGGTLLPWNSGILIKIDGIKHANGSYLLPSPIASSSGECYFWPVSRGWIGEIIPINSGSVLYNFVPASIRMTAPIASDVTFSFVATPK